MSERKPVRSCNGCVFYYVTWEPRTPKGCKYFGFKSAQMPCVVVKNSTGQHCNMYTQKGGQTPGQKKKKDGKGGNVDWTV